MAWKVVSHHNTGDKIQSVRLFLTVRPNIKTVDYRVAFGPHPAKVWVREPGKRRKVKIRATNALAGKGARADEMTDRAKAAQYAFWLAKRDGLDLPAEAYAIPQFTTLRNPTTGKMEKRCMFVQMRVDTKQAQRRAYDVRSIVASSTIDLCRIDIPNWSWFPAEPVESEMELALAA